MLIGLKQIIVTLHANDYGVFWGALQLLNTNRCKSADAISGRLHLLGSMQGAKSYGVINFTVGKYD